MLSVQGKAWVKDRREYVVFGEKQVFSLDRIAGF